MAIKPIYTWDPEAYEAGCVLYYKDKVFTGYAIAHPDDQDFAGELVGCSIAEMRANIALLQYRRDSEILPGLKALKQLYYSMKHSAKFNAKTYESKMLFNQIKIYEEDLELTRKMIENLRENLKTYIDKKDKRYKQLREYRKNSNTSNLDENV